MFEKIKRRKKSENNCSLLIENDGDSVNFTVDWDKDSLDKLSLFIKVLVSLSNGDLQTYIDKAIVARGQENDDKETAAHILGLMHQIQQDTGLIVAQAKYFNKVLTSNKRNPIVAPEDVINAFKNSIGGS